MALTEQPEFMKIMVQIKQTELIKTAVQTEGLTKAIKISGILLHSERIMGFLMLLGYLIPTALTYCLF